MNLRCKTFYGVSSTDFGIIFLVVAVIAHQSAQGESSELSQEKREIRKRQTLVQRCHHCVYHYAKESYERCRHPTPYGGTRGYEDCHGKCYVRMDPNGYVYRGCANREIFPHVNLYHQDACSYQGKPVALWWFCESPLCNHIDLVKSCNDPYYPEKGFFNICDGHCRDPTGSYHDPHNSTYRIQCGYSTERGRRCECCTQYHLRCPTSTVWDDTIKQCSEGRRPPPIIGEGYKYGYE